jgi:hypothetical protein
VFQALGFGEPKRPFLFDDIVGGYIGSVTYAATPLCAAAGPILCSEAHIPRAKTVTDRTLPESATLFPYQMSADPPVGANRRYCSVTPAGRYAVFAYTRTRVPALRLRHF